MPAALSLVPSAQSLSAPPYSDETAAKGWRFEIDYERLHRSDTWTLAPADLRPWLLMQWLTAWAQKPCGSLPNDDALIAAHMGMPLAMFRGHRDLLMRGWWLADNGRLYHRTLSDQVLRMVGTKTAEKDRKRDWRDRQRKQELSDSLSGECPAGQTRTSTGLPRTSTGKDATGTGTGTGSNALTPESPSGDLSSAEPMDASNDVDLLGGPAVAKAPKCPQREILELYARLLPSLPAIAVWSDTRAKTLRRRWAEDPTRQSLKWWAKLFRYVGTSDWLMGKKPPSPGRAPFVADIDFLLKASTFVKLLEGKYHEEAR